MASTGAVQTISLTDTYGYLVYCAGDVIVDAMATEIQQLGAGADTDLTMGIYDVATGALLGSTANVAPSLGINVVALSSPVSLSRGAQYYFALFCARADTNFLRRSPNTVPAPGVWSGKSFGWSATAQRFPASSDPYIGTQDDNPIWIAARAQTTPSVAISSVIVNSTPYNVVAPPTNGELFVEVDTVAIGGVSSIVLPAVPSSNSIVNVKDITGSASVNIITIDGNGNLIDGLATLPINSNYGSYRLLWNGSQWRIV
jgi:hypothetical protein